MDNIVWLTPLYIFDNKDVLRTCKCGYSDGVYHSITGIVYLKDGSSGKMIQRKRDVKANRVSKTTLEAAKAYAEQTWREKQQTDRYKPCEVCPKPEDITVWRAEEFRKWPAVAKSWTKCKAEQLTCSVDNPWLGQPKINGDRCMAWLVNGEVKLYSRRCLEMKFKDNIRRDCKTILEVIGADRGLDGELYSPSDKFHQGSRSKVSRTVNEHEEESDLVFMWFDIVDYDKPFEMRVKEMESMWQHLSERSLSSVRFVRAASLTSTEEMDKYVAECAVAGHEEGIVVRRPNLMYSTKHEHKHCDMVKKKKVEDAEFEVVDYTEGESDRKGCVVWVLAGVKEKKDLAIRFNCDQTGTLEHQRWLYQHAKEYIGRLLTVEIHGGYSAEGIPLQPHGIRFRDAADLPSKKG